MSNKRIKEIKLSAGSTIGGRKDNQDSLLLDSIQLDIKYIKNDFICNGLLNYGDEKRFFLVCDGMGGYESGKEASQMAVEYFSQYLDELKVKMDTIDILKILIEINTKIVNFYISKGEKGGTTISILQLNTDGTAEVYNIGDSPIYMLHNAELRLISEEQSVAGMKLKNGVFSIEEYKNSKEKHILLGFLGDNTYKSLSNMYYSGKIDVSVGDIFIVSSDGLVDAIGKTQLEKLLLFGSNMNELIMEGKRIKNSDNITAIMLEMAG